MKTENLEDIALKRNFQTIEKAIVNGMNMGLFGFLSIKDQEPTFFKWRLMGDCIEVKKSNNRNDKWEIFNEKNINCKFDIGVYGDKFDWSLPMAMTESITER